MSRTLVSVVIPCYNSENSIRKTVEQLQQTLAVHWDVEFVLVYDASPDRTWETLLECRKSYPNITAVKLGRNFGEHNAVMAGLSFSKGDYVVIVDDDLQHPASEAVKLVKEAEKGFDVVYGRYVEKKHSWFRNLGSSFNHKLATWMLGKPKDLYLSSFKAMKGDFARRLAKFSSPYVYVDGMIFWLTRSYTQIDVAHAERADGQSSYTLKKLIRLHLNMLLGFSVLPLRVASILGFTIAGCGLLGIAYVILERFYLNPQIPVGWASSIVTMLFLNGIVLSVLGVLGEYLGRVFLVITGKPQWIADEVKPATQPR